MHPLRRRSFALLMAWLVVPAASWAADTAFRFSDLDVRDPHFFVSFLGCRDVTDTPLGGYSVNGQLQTNITTDGDGDGLLDLSYLLVFNPLDPTASSGSLRFGNGDCTAPMGSTACSPSSTPFVPLTYQNQAAGSCLGVLAGTTHPYNPAVTTTTAPCFVTNPAIVTLNLGGILITLRDTRIAGKYVGNPVTSIANGLLRGFISEADANATILPASFPLVGGQPLSRMLPGGTNNCAPFSDKDTNASVIGWWFYMNFPAAKVPYTDPSTSVGDLSGPGVFLGAAYPNPFGPSVSLEYTLSVATSVHLFVVDAQGRRVADLARGIRPPGRHLVTWDGLDASGARAGAGVYFARIEGLGHAATKRIVLLR